jgi:hypothetical protein
MKRMLSAKFAIFFHFQFFFDQLFVASREIGNVLAIGTFQLCHVFL